MNMKNEKRNSQNLKGGEAMRKTLFVLFAALLSGLALTSSGDDREKGPIQDVFIFAPDELVPGARSSFRVVVARVESLTESDPVWNARVEVVLEDRDGREHTLLRARTDRFGTVEGSVKTPDSLEPGDGYVLSVRVKSRLGDETRESKVRVVRRHKVLLTTDKPLYQPGQLIHIRAVALSTADLEPLAGEELTLEVEDSKGNKVFKKIAKTDDFGVSAADFQLADEINMGAYKVRAVVAGKEVRKTLQVKRYVLPKFKVLLETDRDYYRPAEKVKGSVSAEYFFGKPVAGGQVTISAKAFDFEFHTVAYVRGKTDKDGEYEFEFQLPDYFAGQPLEKGDAFVMIEAEVKDTADHEQTAVARRKVTSEDLLIDLVPEAGRIVPGLVNRLYVVAAAPDDSPVEADVRIEIGDETFEGRSDDTGIAVFEIEVTKNMMVRSGASYSLPVKISAEDEKGRAVAATRELSAESALDGVILRTDRAIYRAGEEMTISALTTFSRGTVYFDAIKNRRTVLTEAADMRDGRAEKRFAIPTDLFGTIELHAYVITGEGNVVRDSRVVYVEGANDLTVSVSMDRETYRPGGEARLVFRVTDASGEGARASLGVSIVDESVFAIQEMRPGLLEVYYTLEKEIMKPRHEVHLIPGGGSVEELIKGDAETRRKRDQVMRVLTAGVESPTSHGWVENPAERRMARELDRLSSYARAFIDFAKTNRFIERDYKGDWRYMDDVTERMATKGMVRKDMARDSFGNYYSPEMLTVLDQSLTLPRVARAVASLRLERVYQGVYAHARSGDDSWLDGLFESGAPGDVDEQAIKRAVEAGHIDKGAAVDPWGNAYVIAPSDKGNPYTGGGSEWKVLSVGPDGKAGADDVTDPYEYGQVPYFERHRIMMKVEEEGVFKRAIGFIGDMAMGAGAAPEMAERATREDQPMPAMADGAAADRDKGSAGVRVREYFPETMYWAPSLVTDSNGKAELDVPVADSITTWRLSALAHSRRGGLGSALSGIRVFQDFFVDIDFPVELTRGDEVEVPVQVYNYLPGRQTVKLEVRDAEGFELLDGGERKVKLESGQVDVVYFRVRADQVGQKSLTVFAAGAAMSDAVKRSVRVVPDGKRFEIVKNGRLNGEIAETIDIPARSIGGASRVIVKIYPGVFSQVLEGLDGLFRMPHGCFEQTTSTTYPNVMVLSYMKKTDTVSPEIRMKAEQFINLGYQRLLSFEVPGGGFEWFGNEPAHKVLTAYGLMEFHDMSQVYPIDESVITRTQRWLADQQAPDGSWTPAEHWMETLSGEAFSRSVELNTAYIAWALADTGYDGRELGKAIDYLKKNLEKIDDAYALALAVNALIAADPDDKAGRDLLGRLDRIKITNDKDTEVHWEPKGQTAVNGTGKAAAIETTALISYAMIRAGVHPNTTNKALAWLAGQKDSFGTFQTTQATILTFKALLAAEAGGAPDVSGDIEVTMGDRTETVRITPETSEVLRQIDFADITEEGENKVTLRADGDMGLSYQVAGIHYIPHEMLKKGGDGIMDLSVGYDRTELKQNDLLTASVKAEYKGRGATDMVILDLGVPPGFELMHDALGKLKARRVIEKYSVTGRQLTVYVARMEAGNPLEFSYKLRAKFPVRAKAPKSSFYQYYNPEIKVETEPVDIEVTR